MRENLIISRLILTATLMGGTTACYKVVNVPGDAGVKDGGAAGGQIVTLADGQDFPAGLTSQGGDLYWADYAEPGAIETVSVSGGASASVQLGRSGPFNIVADGVNLYWIDYGTFVASVYQNDGAIIQAPIAGGDPITLATAQHSPNGIAVGAGYVYWVNGGTTDTNGIPLNDGEVLRTFVGGGAPETLYSGQNTPASIAVDANYVSWVNFGTDDVSGVYQGDGTIVQAALKDLPGAAVVTIAANQADPYGIAVDRRNVYWTLSGTFDSAGNVTAQTGAVLQGSINVAGGAVTTLAAMQSNPTVLISDAVHLYWINVGTKKDGSIVRVPIAGGTVTTIVSKLPAPVGLVLSETAGQFFWTDFGTNGSDGQVLKYTP